MIRILMICHGNICRSPMAEFVLRAMLKSRDISDIAVDSAATSTEELGNPPHPETVQVLRSHGVAVGMHRAVQLTRGDYAKYDYLIGMDRWNLDNIRRITGGDPDGKIFRLLDFTDHPRDIDDPWYTHDFDATYRDVTAGCAGLLRALTGQ